LRLLQRDLARILKKSVLRVPSLRERKDDLPDIVKNVPSKLERDRGSRAAEVTERGLDLLRAYSWPGNVRELEGILWGASVLAGKESISPRCLTPFLSNGHGAPQLEEAALEEMVAERLSALFRRFEVHHLKDLHPMILERVE